MKRILCILIATCFSVSVMAFNDNVRNNLDKSVGDSPVMNHLTTQQKWARGKLVKCHMKKEHCYLNSMRGGLVR